MSTNASIAYYNVESGDYSKIYLHWDGYVSWAGSVLKHYYATADRVKALISLGDISSIGKYIEASPFVDLYGMDGMYSQDNMRSMDQFDDFDQWTASLDHELPFWDKQILNLVFRAGKDNDDRDVLRRNLEHDFTTAYGRDRGETDVEAHNGKVSVDTSLVANIKSIAGFGGQEFNYVFVDTGKESESGWYVVEDSFPDGYQEPEAMTDNYIAVNSEY